MMHSNTIEFILDGKLQQIHFDSNNPFKPSTTVLNYLRMQNNHKGVKEGCAEGDCGACTVVVADPLPGGKLKYTALDSCLVFLPMIQGKQLITVENLKKTQGKTTTLHPVQNMMVQHNGSQCGYCTPGFIMSMFALYKNHHQPNKEIVLDALTGNLCRCTGYQPIINAAMEACQGNGHDHFSDYEKEISEQLLKLKESQTNKILQSGEQTYILPADLPSALKYRDQYPDAVLVCGATDIALRQTKKNEHFKTLIDLSSVSELKQVSYSDTSVQIGAGLSLESLKEISKDKFYALHKMLLVFGSLQIRNIASIGGNIGSASPIGDTLPLLFSYKAVVHLEHINTGRRSVPIEQFIVDYRKTDIKAGELITSISIPFPKQDTIIESYKVSRRKDLDISTVSASFALRLKENNAIESIVIAYGGMAAKTQRANETEKYLINKTWEKSNIIEAMKIIEKEFSPLSDARSSKEARSIAASNLLLKFYQQNLPS